MTTRLRVILWIFALLALNAGVLLFIGADRTEDYFSWTILPPLSAAALGAFYWAALVLIGDAALAGTWERARPALYPVAGIAVLLLAATLIHLDKFDFDSLFGWFWLIIYALVPLVLAWAILDREEEHDARPTPGTGLPGLLRAALVVEGTLMTAMGALMWISPETANDVWPWALTPLTSRALGSFLLGIGLAALLAAREDERRRFRGGADSYAVLGALQLLAVLIHQEDLEGGIDELGTALYVAFFAVVLLTGLWGAIEARRDAPRGEAAAPPAAASP